MEGNVMIKGLTEIVSHEALLGFLAAFGGVTRIVVAGKDNDSIAREIGIVVFCSVPVGVLTGLHVSSISHSPVLPLASAFAAGVISLKVVRFLLSSKGFEIIKRLISGGKI